MNEETIKITILNHHPVLGGSCEVELPEGHRYDSALVRVDFAADTVSIQWSRRVHQFNHVVTCEQFTMKKNPEIIGIFSGKYGWDVGELAALLLGSSEDVELTS